MIKHLNLTFFSWILLFFATNTFAQIPDIYPTHWWVDMKHNQIQLLIKSTDSQFNKRNVSVVGQGVSIDKIHPLENGKYIAIDITISKNAQPGNVVFEFTQPKKKTIKATWSLKPRSKENFAQGVTSKDLIYLIMPDRFSNGDVSNDRIKGMLDQSLNRDSIFLRHGGDLQGIINKLDYLQDLGVTALWLMPVFENNRTERTEHGYGITNHYIVDPRLGNNALYKKLGDELHKRNMKLIQDAIYNHVGVEHFFVIDKPTKDWLNEWPDYTNTTYKDQPLFDPHGAESDKNIMLKGWFTPFMPDLNQNNPYVANFLIYHALWSVEEFGLDGWRIDTYPYNDLEFMNRCNQALLEEYPNISIFGETWVHGVPNQAYFTRNTINGIFKSNLPGVTDFQTNMYGIIHALTEPFGWTNGVNRLYQTLSNDFLYEDPMKNVIFLDNHDMTRFFSSVGEDVAKHKIGIGWLLTSRGIPQLYYGTEINMAGISNPDGWVRLDFPGGWPTDTVNKFNAAGRTPSEEEVFTWTKKLANFRKTSSAITTGKLMQYVPEDGVYVYFRYDHKQTIMCIMNTNDKAMTVKTSRFAERIGNFNKGKDVASNKTYVLDETLSVPEKTLLILELQ
jgi:glycosidase